MTHRTITLTNLRRLNIARQHLAGEHLPAGHEPMLQLVRNIGCLQLDPTNAVARSHLLVLWSRLGKYDPAHLDHLLWHDRSLFEYWAHAASIVLTEDYPIHQQLMRTSASGTSPWGNRMWKWAAENKTLQDHILQEIREKGALPSEHFEDKSTADWHSTGWTGNRNVSQMLSHLWDIGILMVARREGGQRYWDLAERCLPNWTPRDDLPDHEVVRRAAQKSLRALGVGRMKHIDLHYTRNRYPNLKTVLAELETEGIIHRVEIDQEGKKWVGPWYIHTDDLPLLDQIEAGNWRPRTTLLSPFDNLICDRPRTQLLFNFDFRLEIYVPKDKRQYGYFVLPILHGDQLIGRIDPLMNRKKNRFEVNNVYAETDAPMNAETARAIKNAIESLASFLGAQAVDYAENIPDGWKPTLRTM